jgi:hypothetical protein
LLVGGAIWQFSSAGEAQTTAPNSGGSITGAEIIGNNQGGPAAEIQSNGTVGNPSVGADITANGQPGQSVTGLRVIQSGPGTGLRVIQNGPGVGMRVTVGQGQSPKPGE